MNVKLKDLMNVPRIAHVETLRAVFCVNVIQDSQEMEWSCVKVCMGTPNYVYRSTVIMHDNLITNNINFLSGNTLLLI